jgi:TolA-binding protein
VLKVNSVESGHSVATVAPPGKGTLVRRGDKIEPVSAAEAKKFKFLTSRPAASSGTFEQIFGEGGNAPATSEQAAVPQPATQASATQQTPVTQPAATQPVAGGGAPEQRAIEGFDPNQSTDAKVIQTYPISPGEANMLGIRHRNAYNKYNSRKYKDAYAEFCETAEAYNGNYLSAYWAGRAAQNLKKKEDSIAWFDRALSINPNYQPAQEARAKIK